MTISDVCPRNVWNYKTDIWTRMPDLHITELKPTTNITAVFRITLTVPILLHHLQQLMTLRKINAQGQTTYLKNQNTNV